MTEYDAIVKTAKETFAKRIKRALEEKGCETLVKKAELLGVTDDQIRNYEKGRSFPPAGQLVYFARCLGCSVDYLTDERVTTKTPDASIRAASDITGLSEDTIDGLVLMKKAYPSGTAALNALLIDSMGKSENKVEAIGGFLTALSRYFETTLESDNITDGVASKEADQNQKLARLDIWDFTANLLEFGRDRNALLRLYTDKLNELTKKGRSDNGNSKTDNH